MDIFRFDLDYLEQSGHPAGVIAGVDEVGRGSLAGPMVAAGVVLDYGGSGDAENERSPHGLLGGLADSKCLTPAVREKMATRVLGGALRVFLVSVSPQTIDRVGLHRCNLNALTCCLNSLQTLYDVALVDGFDVGDGRLRAEKLIRGDGRSAAVAAASVVAKVMRDRFMASLHETHPGYGFHRNKGYGTPDHRAALESLGASPAHRLSFAGVGVRQLTLG